MREMRTARRPSWHDINALLLRAREGDESSRDMLFGFLRTRLLAIARFRVSDAAEDTVHDSLIIVHKRLSEFEDFEVLLAFTHQVLRNKIGNIYQGRTRHQNQHAEINVVSEPRYSIDGDLESSELERIVRRSIEKLGESRPYCKTILLCLFQGLDPTEICEYLGITKSKLKVQTFRCRTALKEILSGDYGMRL